MYNRREVLKLFGFAAVAPTLLVREEKLLGKTLKGDIIPTGFPIIDEALQGGFQKGEIGCVYGIAQSRTIFLQSLAVNMSEVASVALITRRPTRVPTETTKRLECRLKCNVTVWNPQDHQIRFEDQWRMLTDQHDVIILDSDWISGFGWLYLNPADNECTIIISDCDHMPLHNIYLGLEDQDYSPHKGAFGRLFTVCLTKNRRGKSHVVEPICFDWRGFMPLTKTNYWSYDRGNGVIIGPYGVRQKTEYRLP